MEKKTNKRVNRPHDYESKFKNLILEYLRKQNRLVNIPELDQNIKDEPGIPIRRQTLRYNLRILGISGEINVYVKLNPIKGYEIPKDDEVFIGLPISNTDEHPKLLLNIISRMNVADQSYTDFKQLFIKRAKENVLVDIQRHEEKLQKYQEYLRIEHKYTEKEIIKHLKVYKKENIEPALDNAEEEANRLANFLITDATEEFKKKVANQLSTKNKDGKYDLGFEYKI